ncbi:hypothetical protein ACIQ9P_10050 [Kitasatospora sp. NPDC094019]|uniref:hypothetical protein n=1 Tax=Kitasatospora sp. NPDC094019 TaxID=3364091 RepID=UPI0037FFE4E5
MSTPRPDSDPAPVADGDADRTVRVDPPADGGTETVRLGSGAGSGSGTDAPGGPVGGGPAGEVTVRIDASEATSATFLDAGVWGGAGETVEALTLLDTPAHGTATPAEADPALTVTVPAAGPPSVVAAPGPAPADLAPAVAEAALTVTAPSSTPVPAGATPPPGPAPARLASSGSSVSGSAASVPSVAAPAASAPSVAAPAAADREDERPLAPGELRRFGPGVPPLAAAVWHGAAVPGTEPPRRRVWRWLLPLLLLLAVLALLFWRFSTPALAVTGVGVTTDPAGPGCDSVAVVKAVVETNGAGTLRYRWLRSDGTTSAEIGQDIGSGTHRTELVLRWNFEGRGTLAATATLEILAPGSRTAAVSFPYHCA